MVHLPEKNFGVVLCLEASAATKPLLEELKNKENSFYQRLWDKYEEFSGTCFNKLKAKLITFSGDKADSVSIAESGVFNLGEDGEDVRFRDYVGGIEVSDRETDIKAAVKALLLALESLKSVRSLPNAPRRPAVVFVTCADPRINPGNSDFGSVMMYAMKKKWNRSHGNGRKSILQAFAPACNPWIDFMEWDDSSFVPLFPGDGIDLGMIIFLLAKQL